MVMLERYLEILRGGAEPHFKRARALAAGMGRDELEEATLEELWRRHELVLRGDGEAAVTTAPRDAVSLLELKGEIARRMLRACCFCEHCCGVDRQAGDTGVCGVPARSRYASEFLHFGEEPELVPSHTIFFTGCTFKCVYCQNWDIATRPRSGEPVDPGRLALTIAQGWRAGSRNVNFVGGNPDSHLHTCIDIISRLEPDIPVVWNSNAYASRQSMALLDGIVDIFLSDFRYGNDDCARKLSGVGRYLDTVERNLVLASDHAEVMLRHLVLPGHLECCTRPIMEWTAANLPGVYFNLMFQYRPVYRAGEFPGIDRLLTGEEKQRARDLAARFGIAVQ